MDRIYIALHQAALDAEGGITGVARRLGKRQQTLINKLNPLDCTHEPTVGEFVAVMMDTGDTTALESLCALFGGQFVTRPQGRMDSVLAAVVHANNEHADIGRAVEECIADGEIDGDKAARIYREISEARRAINIAENTIRAYEKGGLSVVTGGDAR